MWTSSPADGGRLPFTMDALSETLRVVRLVGELDGEPLEVTGGAFVLSGGAANSAALLLRSRSAVSRRHLADLLFADAEDPQAALRWNLSELRKLLGSPGLQGELLASWRTRAAGA